ncbi:MAG: hypothetical protein R3B84_20410 [Zavarzinella sp.]
MSKPFLDSAARAWIITGLEELRQAVHPSNDQVRQPDVPGIWGNPTTGEVTHERMQTEREQAVERESPAPEKRQQEPEI